MTQDRERTVIRYSKACRVRPARFLLAVAILAGVATPSLTWSADTEGPHYKPASRAPAPMDIRTNAYGASRSAPSALGIGDLAPDFLIPGVAGEISLERLRALGDVVLVFYRGHW